jgi:hypothetical protein
MHILKLYAIHYNEGTIYLMFYYFLVEYSTEYSDNDSEIRGKQDDVPICQIKR